MEDLQRCHGGGHQETRGALPPAAEVWKGTCSANITANRANASVTATWMCEQQQQ